MLSYINRLQNFWNQYGFEILVCISILLILILFLYRWCTGKKGTYNTHYYLPKTRLRSKIASDRRYPRHSDKRPRKKDSKGETECRRVLMKIFNKPFEKDRPEFLNNPVTGGRHNLELDCFNKDLRIAVEYNGIQHYKFIPFFHKNKESFQNQKYRDYMKRQMCKENGIILIEVPYWIKEKDIENFIKKELTRLGVQIRYT